MFLLALLLLLVGWLVGWLVILVAVSRRDLSARGCLSATFWDVQGALEVVGCHHM